MLLCGNDLDIGGIPQQLLVSLMGYKSYDGESLSVMHKGISLRYMCALLSIQLVKSADFELIRQVISSEL